MNFTAFVQMCKGEPFPLGDMAWKIINDNLLLMNKSDEEVIKHLRENISAEWLTRLTDFIEQFRTYNSGYIAFSLDSINLVYPNLNGETPDVPVPVLNQNILRVELEQVPTIPISLQLVSGDATISSVSYDYNKTNTFFIPPDFMNSGMTIKIQSSPQNQLVKGKFILLTSTQSNVISVSATFPKLH